MHLASFQLENVKCFADASLTFRPDEEGSRAGWNVILGRNGSGKSTLLQAMALSLVGPTVGLEHLRWGNRDAWLREEATHATLQASIAPTEHDRAPSRRVRLTPYGSKMFITGNRKPKGDLARLPMNSLTLDPSTAESIDRGPYSGGRGWFSVGYGPFRRMSGGSEDEVRRGDTESIVERHASLFHESVALTRCEPWLRSLYVASIDRKNPKKERDAAKLHMKCVRSLIDSLLASFGVRLRDLSSELVTFTDSAGMNVELTELSDGFGSFLALTVDLLRQIIDANEWGEVRPSKNGGVRIDTEGVVLIDEADAHLHPGWQRELGFRLCEVFPKIQFIVSSHSPFLAQAARPGGLFVLRERNGEVQVEQPEESVEGWPAEQILLSPLFGLKSTRDPDTEDLMHARATLLGLPALNSEQEATLARVTAELRARLRAPGDTLDDLDTDARIDAYLRSRETRR